MADLQRALGTIRAVAQVAQGDQALSDLLARVCGEVADGFSLDRVVISRLVSEPSGEVVVALAGRGMAAEALAGRRRVDESPHLERALETAAVIHVHDARGEASLLPEVGKPLGLGSAVVVPLFSVGRCIGFMLADRGGTVFELDDSDRDVLACVGALVATVLEKGLIREEMQRLAEAKTQFTALASHELRTPIAAVYGILATLHNLGGRLREEQRVELRATAFHQAERLRRLADQLLDLSRIDAASVRLHPEPTPVRRKLEEIVLVIGEKRAVEVAIDAAPDLEIALDPTAFDRIVSNLLLNALRYGAPPVHIEATKQDTHFRVFVEDAGPGVPAEFVPALFERFTRGEQSAQEAAQGSGLGLSIAQAYARAHGGEVLYHDVTPHGARFELVLPLAFP